MPPVPTGATRNGAGKIALKRRLLTSALALALAAGPAMAQQTATAGKAAMLVADRIYMEGPQKLVAEGHVEALQGDVRLRAGKVIYDQQTGKLSLQGPITLTEQGGQTVIVADSGQLDDQLRNGLLRGARMMMNQQVQLAAAQVARIEGRYTQLYKTSVTSCHVCGNGAPPLWQIRADSVVHDQQAHQLYFEKARIEVKGIPILYLPYLRLPDPTQKRASGFLIPEIRTNTKLGTGFKLPYFIAMGDHRDLTLTPYISSETRTMEFRYRQAYRTGALSLIGAVSKDNLDSGQDLRGYLDAEGLFYLPRDFTLSFSLKAVSDPSYPSDYDYSDQDRLRSNISLERARRDEWIGLSFVHYRSLREDETMKTIPSVIEDFTYEKRYHPSRLGGELRFDLDQHAHYRISDSDTDGSDSDSVVDGRDVARLTFSSDWQNTWTLRDGFRLTALGGAAVDNFRTFQDASLPDSQTGVTPYGSVTLRLPLERASATGQDIIEPVAQIAWSGGSNLKVANDESTRSEFDEGNLFGLTRFAAPDRRERGWRAAYGASWTHLADAGWTTRLVFGQVYQQDVPDDFTRATGLDTQMSDYLLAGQITARDGWSITARGLFDHADIGTVDKAEALATWVNKRASLEASYVWLPDDDTDDLDEVNSEWNFGGSYQFNDTWGAEANLRYDMEYGRASKAGLAVTWRNECVDVTMSLDRSYGTSEIVSPSTDVALTVGLRGFSVQSTGETMRKTCSN